VKSATQPAGRPDALSRVLDRLRQRLGDAAIDENVFGDAYRLAALAATAGEGAAACDVLQRLEEICRAKNLPFRADFLASQRLYLLVAFGRVDDAGAMLNTFHPTMGDICSSANLRFTAGGMSAWEAGRNWVDEGGRGALFGAFYLGIGSLLSAGGSYGPAVTALRRGLDWSLHAPDLAAPLRVALAAASLEAGDLNAANTQLDILQTVVEPAEEPACWVRMNEIAAQFLLFTGKFGAATDRLDRVVLFLAQARIPHAEIRVWLNLAYACIFLHQIRRAVTVLESIQEIVPAGDLSERVAQLLAWARGRSLTAEQPAPSVTQMLEEPEEPEKPGQDPLETGASIPPPVAGPARPGSFLAWQAERERRIHWGVARGDWRWVTQQMRSFERDFAHSDSALVQLRLRALRGALAYYQGRYSDAVEMFTHVRRQAHALCLKVDQWQALRFLGWCDQRLAGGQRAARDRFLPEWSRLLDDMSDSLPPPERLLFLGGQWAADEEALDAELRKLGSTPDQAAIYGFLDRAYRSRRLLGGAGQAVSIGVMGLSRLPAAFAVLFFVVLPERTFVAWSSGGRVLHHTAPVGRDRIRRLVGDWHANLRDAAFFDRLAADPRRDREEAAKFREQAIQFRERAIQVSRTLPKELGLETLLSPDSATSADRLIVVPDDGLHGFPFAALKIGGAFLVERFAISLNYCYQSPLADRKPVGPVWLAPVTAENSRYPKPSPACDLSGFSKLRWVRDGRVRVQPVLPNKDINRDSLLRLLPDAGLFHFFGHGEFDPNRPEQTGLVLIPEDGGPEEFLSVNDLAGLRCPHLAHVTLAACWGSDGYVMPGHYTVGLAESFCRAGAASVLASLWPAGAATADAFTFGFYSLLGEYPRDEAVRLVQLELLRGNCDVREWAGWQLYGDPGPLLGP
jgi:tetratricopeptide (TPR) repeat protein